VATLAKLDVLLGLNSARFSRGLKRAQYKARKFGREMQNAGRGLTTGLTLPIVAVGVAAAKMSMGFDESLSRIVGLVGVAEDQVASWRGELLKLGPAVGKAPQELAEAMFFITSAGLRGEAALKALEASAKASAAGLGETEAVADAITSALNAYGQETMTAAQATSVLVATVREGKAAAASLAPTIGRVLPIAAELGVSFDQVGASLAAMTRLGLNAEEATTALRATMSTILKPSAGARKALADMNIPIEKLRDTLKNKGLLDTLFLLRDALEQNDIEVTKIFPNVRALTGVLNLTGAAADNARQIFESLAGTTEDDLATAFEAIPEATLAFRSTLATIKAELVRFGDEILPALVPVMTGIRDTVARLGTAFAGLSPETKALGLGLVAFAAALGPVLWALGTFVFFVGSLSGTVVAVVAALGAGAVLLVTQWDKVKAAVAAFVEFARPALEAFGQLASELWTEILATAREVWPAIKEVVAEFVSVARALWAEWGDAITNGTRRAWLVFSTVIKNALQVALGVLRAFIKFQAGDFTGAWKTLLSTASQVWNGIGRIVRASSYNMLAALSGLAAGTTVAVIAMVERLRALAAAWAAMPWATPGRAAAELALGPIDAALAGLGGKVEELKAAQDGWNQKARDVLEPLTRAKTKMVEMQSAWVEVSAAADASIGQNIITFTRAADDTSRKLRGSFSQAVDDAFAGATAKYEEVASDIEARPVRITFDISDLQRKMDEAGMAPNTAGALPGA
jgi:TP901 family phage tail tape measure protein